MEALIALHIMAMELDVLEAQSKVGKYVSLPLPHWGDAPEPIILHAFRRGCREAVTRLWRPDQVSS